MGVKRNTAREEDRAYCLLGILDIYMLLIYGEREKAFSRLRREIDMQGTFFAVYNISEKHS